MAGPSPMALGPFAFEALGFGFDGVGRDLSTDWAQIRVAQGWDGQQWLGPQSDSVRIRGAVFPEAFGGLSSLDGIRAAAIAGEPLFLVTLGGNIVGLFVVSGVREDRSFHDARGMPRKDSYEIALRAYGGGVAAAMSTVIRLFT